ncbi:MAG: hypothetical protein OSB10_07350 [Planctomycetota bacterium]|nr:hypothetical protein [Planctomycetota bacterium]
MSAEECRDPAQGVQPGRGLLLGTLAICCASLVAAVFEVPGFLADGLVFKGIDDVPAATRLPWARLFSLGTGLGLTAFLALLFALRAAWSGRLSVRAFLASAYVLSIAMTLGLSLSGEARGFSLAKSVYYQGYVSDAHDFAGPGDVVQRYNENFKDLLPHSRTHPPGPVLFFTGTNALSATVSTWPADAGGFSSSEVLEFFLEGNLGGTVLLLCAWLLLFPLFEYTRRVACGISGVECGPDQSVRAGLLAVGLAATCANILVVAPMTDVLHPVLGICAALALQRGLAEDRASWCVLAGLFLGALLIMAFGNLAIAPLLLWMGLGLERRSMRRAMTGALGLLGGVAVIAGLMAGWGYNYVEGLQSALEFHGGGVNSERGYVAYLFGSPYTFLLWLGAPILVGACLGRVRLRLQVKTEREGVRLGLFSLFAILVLSGISRGETERLWLPLVPFFIAIAATGWAPRLTNFRSVATLLAVSFTGSLVLGLLTKQY